MIYELIVVELRKVPMTYEVEAESEKEAVAKALCGQTSDSYPIKGSTEILDRYLEWGEPVDIISGDYEETNNGV